MRDFRVRIQPHLTLDDVQFFERAITAWDSVRSNRSALDYFIPIDQFLHGRELLVASHKMASRFMSTYIKECPLSSLRRLFTSFSGHFLSLSIDRYASHSVENLIIQASPFIDDGFRNLCVSLITELTPNAAILAEDLAGSHVARAIITEFSKEPTLIAHIDKFVRKILQNLVAKPEIVRFPKFLRYLKETMPISWEVIREKNPAKAIERMIECIGQEVVSAVFAAVFQNRSVEAAFDPIANFVIQRWLEFAKLEEEIVIVAEQLIPYIPRLLERRPQVVISLAVALERVGERHQKAFLDVLSGEGNIVEYLNELSHGSKILQAICRFQNGGIRVLLKALKKLNRERIVRMARDMSGSFFLSTFFESVNIPLADRQKVVEDLFPHMAELAVDEHGVSVVRSAFKSLDLLTKSRICENLNRENIRKEQASLWQKFRMEQFIHQREKWEQDIERLTRKEEVMDEIIEVVGVTDVEPITPPIVAPTPEMEAVKEELQSILGGLHRGRRKHEHSDT
jgi:nucleolar protein 9